MGWLNETNIKGPAGPPGADSTVPGPAGPAGPQGVPGAASTVPGPAGPTGSTGATGSQGPAGSTGPTGATGPGVAPGGTTGQVLTKTSATDYATNWQTPAAGGSMTGAQILTALAPVDGSGSGLDADLLDGQSGAYYLDNANSTGILPAASFNDTTHGNGRAVRCIWR